MLDTIFLHNSCYTITEAADIQILEGRTKFITMLLFLTHEFIGSRVLAQVIFESQRIRSQGEMETIPVQPFWLVDSLVTMVSYSNYSFTLKYRQCTKLTSEFGILSLTVFWNCSNCSCNNKADWWWLQFQQQFPCVLFSKIKHEVYEW